MGQAKKEMDDYYDRGWCAPDKFVCENCVGDSYLKVLIRENAVDQCCDYCGDSEGGVSVALVEAIMPAISSALYSHYADPVHAGVPYDGGFVIEPVGTEDALMGLPLYCQDDLFQDVANAFSNDGWVPAAEGSWASSHYNEERASAWSGFSYKVKHSSRYFFMLSISREEFEAETPFNILQEVGELAEKYGLIGTLEQGCELYRVRDRAGGSDWPLTAEELGAPPSHLASAGRMNPAGISYLYLSQTTTGALAEVLRGPPCCAAVATFKTVRPIKLLNLANLPEEPSVFDAKNKQLREAVLFLQEFIFDICRPVVKDGKEHIDYVPSQVVSEYFSQIFKTQDGKRLNGIAYPSAILPGSVNFALFPRGDFDSCGQVVNFDSAVEVNLKSWLDFSGLTSLN